MPKLARSTYRLLRTTLIVGSVLAILLALGSGSLGALVLPALVFLIVSGKGRRIVQRLRARFATR